MLCYIPYTTISPLKTWRSVAWDWGRGSGTLNVPISSLPVRKKRWACAAHLPSCSYLLEWSHIWWNVSYIGETLGKAKWFLSPSFCLIEKYPWVWNLCTRKHRPEGICSVWEGMLPKVSRRMSCDMVLTALWETQPVDSGLLKQMATHLCFSLCPCAQDRLLYPAWDFLVYVCEGAFGWACSGTISSLVLCGQDHKQGCQSQAVCVWKPKEGHS